MARIPGSGELGQARPQVQRMTVQGGSDAITQGAAHLAGQLGQIADDMAQQKMAEAKLKQQRQEEADRLKTAASLSQYERDLTDLRSKVQGDVTMGKVSRDDAQKQFQTDADSLTNGLYEKVPQKLRDAAKIKADEVMWTQHRGMGTFLDENATSEARGNLETVRKALTTQGLASEGSLETVKAQYRTALEANKAALRYSPEQTAKLATDFAGDVTYDHFAQQLAERPDDIKYVRQLKTRLGDEKQLTDLDAPRRTQLMHTADTLEDRWEAEQKRMKAEAEARSAVDASGVQAFLVNGGHLDSLPPADRARANAVFASDKYGPKAKGWLQTNRAVIQLNSLPLSQQAAALKQAESAVQSARGIDAFNDARDTLGAMQQNHARNVQAYQADPLTYTAGTLLKEDITPLNWNDSASLPAQLKARREQAARAGRMNGTRVPPLTASEAATMTQIANSLPPQDGAKFLQQVSDNIGVSSMPLVAQMMSKDGDPVLVGAAALSGKTSTDGRPVSALALRGREVLKNKEVKMPEETKLRSTFAASTGMGGPGMEMAFQTAQAIYAAKAREEGVTEASGGKPDARLWRQAVNLATGGVYDHKGQKLVAPVYGLSQSEFEDRLAQVKPEDLQRDAGQQQLYVDGQPITYEKAASYLRQAPLGNGSREGTVWVRAGGGMIMQQDGSPLMVTIPATTATAPRMPVRLNTSMMMPGM